MTRRPLFTTACFGALLALATALPLAAHVSPAPSPTDAPVAELPQRTLSPSLRPLESGAWRWQQRSSSAA